MTERDLQFTITAVRILPSIITGVSEPVAGLVRWTAEPLGGAASGRSLEEVTRRGLCRREPRGLVPHSPGCSPPSGPTLTRTRQTQRLQRGEHCVPERPAPWGGARSLPLQGDSATWSHLLLAVGLKPFNVTKLTYGLFRVRKDHGKQPFCFYVRPPRGTTEAEPWEPETQVCGREPPPAAGFPS